MPTIKNVPGPGRKQLEILTKGLNGVEGRVGWGQAAKYEDGTSIAVVAAVQEFGSPAKGIPPRSFMRTTTMEQKSHWAGMVETAARGVAEGKLGVDQVMQGLTQQAAGDVRKKITEITSPELLPETIKSRIRRRAPYQNLKTREGKAAHSARELAKAGASISKPLIDTGEMLATLSSEVTKA